MHSIFLVEELRRLWKGKYERALPELTELVRGTPDLPSLYLGCLLHDIGKGLRGGHSGIEIDKGRGNALKILNREPFERQVFIPFRLVTRENIGGYTRPND